MTSCYSCGASIMFQTDHSQCGHCGALLSSVVIGVDTRVTPPPDQEEVYKQLLSALEHAREYHKSQGQDMTWEITDTGATYYLDGELAGEARFQARSENITESIYITKIRKCPHCQAILNAMSGGKEGVIPEAGELTVCANCVTVLVVTEHGGLRLATQKELRRLDERSREDLAGMMRDLRIQKRMGIDTYKGLNPNLRSQWEI